MHSRLPDPAPNSRRRWAIYAVGVAGFVISMFYRVSTGVISLDLSNELALTSAQMGRVSSAFFYAFAISQLPLILVLSRFGPRKTMATLSGVAVAGSLLFAFAGSYAGVVAARALLGIGMSCHLMGMMAILAAWFPVDRFATLSGILLGAATVGNIAASTPLTLMNQAIGWRGSFIIMAVACAAQAVLFFIICRDRPPAAAGEAAVPAENPFKGFGALLAMPAYWSISFLTFIRYGTFVALQGLWAFPFLAMGLGLSALAASNAILALALGSMLGPPLLGRLSDHTFQTRKWVAAPAFFVVGLILLSLAWVDRGTPHLVIFAIFFVGGFFWTGPGLVLYAHIKELVPANRSTAAMTGVNLFTMLGAAMVTEFVGYALGGRLKDIKGPEDFTMVWLLFAGILFFAIVTYLFVPDSQALKPVKPGKE